MTLDRGSFEKRPFKQSSCVQQVFHIDSFEHVLLLCAHETSRFRRVLSGRQGERDPRGKPGNYRFIEVVEQKLDDRNSSFARGRIWTIAINRGEHCERREQQRDRVGGRRKIAG